MFWLILLPARTASVLESCSQHGEPVFWGTLCYSGRDLSLHWDDLGWCPIRSAKKSHVAWNGPWWTREVCSECLQSDLHFQYFQSLNDYHCFPFMASVGFLPFSLSGSEPGVKKYTEIGAWKESKLNHSSVSVLDVLRLWCEFVPRGLAWPIHGAFTHHARRHRSTLVPAPVTATRPRQNLCLVNHHR